MHKRYRVKDCPGVQEVIAFNDLKDIGEGGFLIFIVDALSSDELEELREELDNVSEVPKIFSTNHMTVHEVIDKLENADSTDDL